RRALATQARHGNRHVQRLLAARAPLARDETAPEAPEASVEEAPKDLPTAIGFIGMNPAAWKEVEGLKKKTQDIVIASLDDPEAAKDLATAEGRIGYVLTTLGINPALSLARFVDVWSALEAAEPNAREQVGALMQMFQGAESGRYTLERLVMSGHSNGIELWGEAEGENKPGKILLARELENLTRLFPTAAGQVEDIMFSACFSANAIVLVQRVFPNLQTAWGYAEFSPSVASGSIGHIAKWEQSTAGDEEPGERDKRGSSAIWTRDEGFVVNDPANTKLETVIFQVNRLGEYVTRMNSGQDALDQSVLRQFYTSVQQVLTHPDSDDAIRARAEGLRDKTLRLRFWTKVSEEFQKAHATKIAAAHAEIGLKAPNFGTLSRADLLKHMMEYDNASSGKDAPAAADFRVQELQGLWDLDPAYVLTEWI
ncbi:MAG: hypothetical protein O2895_07105, partial [Chloroflexi bacterium]|nr:hypothetical protein [Chloroflexota bacterium]